MDCYVFDMDGTLSDCSHRLHHVREKPKNYKKFYDDVLLDKPIEPILSIARLLQLGSKNIVISTGRDELCFDATKMWLDIQRIYPKFIFMRNKGDSRQDFIVKKEHLDKMKTLGLTPIAAFDDRTRVVDMWRENGIQCLQVAPGDY